MNTIFRKQLVLYLGTLAISLGFLGVMLAQVIRIYVTEQRIAILTDSSVRVSEVLEGVTHFGIFDVNRLNNEVLAMQQFLDARLLIISTDFTVIGTSGGLVDEQMPVYHETLQPLMLGETIVANGTLDGIYLEPLLTVGRPIWAGDTVVAAVLVSTSMHELETTISEMHRLTLLCLLGSAVVATVLIYFWSLSLSRPLSQINDAARIIASGNLEKRISIKTIKTIKPTKPAKEVVQLAKSFNSMAESLQEQKQTQRTFIANLSHDIRSPLTSVRGFLQAISDGTIPPERQNYYISLVLDESDRIIKLANSLLELNFVQESTLKLSTFNVVALIRKIVLAFEPQATIKNLQIKCNFAHETDIIEADYDKIHRVIYNLVDNSAKFVPHGGEIIIETSIKTNSKNPNGKNAEQLLQVSIQDNGRGISLADQSKIFERFFKGDQSRNEHKAGNGLGLPIVKEIITAHGGQIFVDSAEQNGCLITFSIPLTQKNFQ
ncbi:MAG: HAMP domain-containing histidine kinase [Defluviitaleaceae bacterium]|nr:HAMP domain-containing histidine kinase [Defluviitaleaceae bacterium]